MPEGQTDFSGLRVTPKRGIGDGLVDADSVRVRGNSQIDGNETITGNLTVSGTISGGSAGIWKTPAARAKTVSALAAYTRTVNVILADANGAWNNAVSDSVAVVAGNTILITDGAATEDNGIYVFDSVGSAASRFQLTRRSDANTSAKVTSGMSIHVSEGTVNADSDWQLSTNDPITLNTTGLAFVEFDRPTVRDGLVETGDIVDVNPGDGLAITGGGGSGGAVLVVAADASIVVAAGGISVQPADASLATGGGGLAVQHSGNATTQTAGAGVEVTPDSLSARESAVLADAASTPGTPVVLTYNLVTGITFNNDFNLDFRIEILEVTVQKRGATGDTGDTVQVQTPAGVAISDVFNLAIADATQQRSSTIDDATSTLSAASPGIRIRQVNGGGVSPNTACQVTVLAVRRA